MAKQYKYPPKEYEAFAELPEDCVRHQGSDVRPIDQWETDDGSWMNVWEFWFHCYPHGQLWCKRVSRYQGAQHDFDKSMSWNASMRKGVRVSSVFIDEEGEIYEAVDMPQRRGV